MQSTYGTQLSSGSLSIGGQEVINADTNNPLEVTIPAAKAGTLSTRTDNDTGIVTVASGHGITTSDKIDLYDATGVIIRKDMDVTAVGGTTVSIDAGTGSNLPIATTAVRVAKRVLISPVFYDASGIQIFGIQLAVPGATSKGRANFLSSVPASVGDMSLTANKGLITNVAAGATNPLSADAVAVHVTNGNDSIDGTLTVISMEDRTP
jgi:hypothetical protein